MIVQDSNDRIDKYLAGKTDYSREYIAKLIKNNMVMVNGKMIKPSYRVSENDEIIIDDKMKNNLEFESENIPIEVVYEDKYLMVINKPNGLVVHPGNGNRNHTLVNALMYHTKNLSDVGGCERMGIVHRLDKDTTGLMLVAKDNKTHEILADDFKYKRVKREYIALVNGVMTTHSAKIDAPIGRSKSDFRKMEVRADGKKAVTNLSVIKTYQKYTLIRLSLETGRTHQIRCHLAYIGYPVFNDPVYSNNNCTDFGQFLHSTSIDFEHPITQEHLHFDCPLPKYFQDFIDKLDKEG
jgi:23S rRNA pseudouridine1911/1915/1917 synthase